MPSVKIGKARRIPASVLETYLVSQIAPTDADVLSVSEAAKV
jgi:hypothetical protein